MSSITCATAREQFSLLLYGELSFDDEERLESHLGSCTDCSAGFEREKSLHASLDGVEITPSPSLLRVCREELRARLIEESVMPRAAARVGWWEQFTDLLTGRKAGFDSGMSGRGGFIWKPAAALSLIAIGFFAARLTPVFSMVGNGGQRLSGIAGDPGSSRVRYVEPGSDGKIQIVLDETRQRVVTGRMDDQKIRVLLLSAAQDPADPGLRAETVGILNTGAQSAEVRDALIQALRHDQNAGVRLKALEGLKTYAQEREVRAALADVLLRDTNPGVRTQAIDLLTGSGAKQTVERNLVGMLQELMSRENNAYIRERCRRVLEAMNASVETY
jgi:hypothetical protein